jgi:hypothetical protein
MAAHRVAYIAHYKENPKAWLRHTCDVNCCVNPIHLIPGTPKENAQDRIERNRSAAPSEMFTHSRKGKPISEAQRAAIIANNIARRGPRPKMSAITATKYAERIGIAFSKWPREG